MAELRPLNICKIKGLSKRADLNGIEVKLVRFDKGAKPSQSRWAVTPLIPLAEGTGLRVKAANLEFLRESDPVVTTPPEASKFASTASSEHDLNGHYEFPSSTEPGSEMKQESLSQPRVESVMTRLPGTVPEAQPTEHQICSVSSTIPAPTPGSGKDEQMDGCAKTSQPPTSKEQYGVAINQSPLMSWMAQVTHCFCPSEVGVRPNHVDLPPASAA